MTYQLSLRSSSSLKRAFIQEFALQRTNISKLVQINEFINPGPFTNLEAMIKPTSSSTGSKVVKRRIGQAEPAGNRQMDRIEWQRANLPYQSPKCRATEIAGSVYIHLV